MIPYAHYASGASPATPISFSYRGAKYVTANGTHVYDAADNVQAVPSSSIVPGMPYSIAATRDGIWNVQIYESAFSAAQIGALARPAPPDPYSAPTPNPKGAYTNAHPAPEGGAFGGTTVGPAYATDAFHIDWDAFCVALPSHCSNGDPHYVSRDASMIADTLPSSLYGAGVSDICTGEVANTPGSENPCASTGVGAYYTSASDPLVTISCTIYPCAYGPSGTSGSLNHAKIYIPYGALPQQGGDGHLNVRQPSGVICQVWIASNPHNAPITSSSLAVGNGACGPPNYASEGSTLLNGGGYAAGDEIGRGLVRPEDIVGSRGDGTDSGDPYSFYHAMYGGFSNNQHGVVWPGIGGDGQCTASNTINGVMPNEGMYLYLDTAGFRILKIWNPPIYLRWLKRALGSIHRHGMIDMDSSGCTNSASHLYTNTLEWGSQSYVLGGGKSPIDAYLANYIHPYDRSFVGSPGGNESAVYVSQPSAAYAFDVLWYEDVPGLTAANFHWINKGCGQIAVQGTSNNGC